jgi:glucose-1-phosphate cytidylyltransferase
MKYLNPTHGFETTEAIDMKAVILAGGFGSRLSEETMHRPKPMVDIGGKPILWHIMKIFSTQGVNEFIIALGYKSEYIKDYFMNAYVRNNNITVDLATGKTHIHDGYTEKWIVHLVDTGLYTQTGGRLKRLQDWLEPNETFFFTYGDGVADVDVKVLMQFHQTHGKLASMTTVQPPERFGRIAFEEDCVTNFYEKVNVTEVWINGGFFVLNTRVLDYIDDDTSIWEREPVERLAREGQLMGYRHSGFWSCMDTLKEKNTLEELWGSGNAPWKMWE